MQAGKREEEMDFFTAMTTKDELTENAMLTHSTSGNAVLDWFFKMGGLRNLSEQEVVGLFRAAWAENRILALKSIFALRNVRGGMGERRSFRLVARWLAKSYPDAIESNLHNIPHFGRWDDVLHVCVRTSIEKQALSFVFDALSNGDRLCAKWMPREGKSLNDLALYLASSYNLSRAEYRKLLSGSTQVVESLMCSNRWSEIEFSKVPSVAFRKYKKAFAKHQPDRFSAFLEKVESGEERVHAGAIFPHDIIKPLLVFGGCYDSNVVSACNAQWKCLPDYNVLSGTLVVSDVSGSMNGWPLLVSISLGIYFAERLNGQFKNLLVTFSERPTFFRIPSGNIADKVNAVAKMNWDMNTNLEAVFSLILDQALKHNLSQESVPSTVLIISDMQFDRCIEGGDNTAMEMIREKYQQSGYSVPNVVFWNVRSSIGIPAKMNESGVGLLSGFSPSLVRSMMEGEIDPMSMMLRILNDQMYDCVVT